MPYLRLHARRSLLIAVVGVAVLALGVFRHRLAPPPTLPQRPPAQEDDPREEHAEAEEAIAWRLMRMRDENGQIPDGALMRATGQMYAMRGSQAGESRLSATSTISWTSIGPSNVGGRVRSIAIHPNDPNTIFAGAAGGGIWRTTNGGASWSPVNDFMASLAVTSIVFTPTNPAVMFAATGEGLAGTRGIRGAGVFKSTDAGATWNQLSATANINFDFVNRVAVSPDGTTLLAATLTGIYRSTDGGATFPAANVAGPIGDGIAQVVFDPNNSSRAVAGAARSSTNPPAAWFSTDAGATWTPVTGLPLAGRVELAYARSVANKVYASVNGGIPVGNRNRIFVSTNGGQSFTLATSGTSPNFLGVQVNWTNALWVDPTNDQLLVVGGIDLFRSTDGGSTLTQLNGFYSVGDAFFQSGHADHHAIVSAPNYDGATVKTVFVGNDGGVYKVGDITTATVSSGWTDLNNGLTVTQFYTLATNVATGSILGGTQDNGILRKPGSGTTWSSLAGGDGGFVATDPVNATYYSSLSGRLFRSENDGTSLGPEITGDWCPSLIGSTCKDGPKGAFCQDTKAGHANFLTPLVLDPNNPDRLLVGADHLFVTTDPRTEVGRCTSPTASGPSWFEIKPSTGQYISAVAVSPTSSNIIAVGHNDGAVYITTNGTNASPTWAKLDDNTTALPNRMVTSITFSAANPNTLWVTFGGFTSQNIWKSTNLGGSWSPVGTALPAAPVYDLKYLSSDENSLYLATEIGLFASPDGGANWMQDGPANVPVEQLAWLGPTTLVAATHGRGMFKATVGGPPTTMAVGAIWPKTGPSAGGSAVTITGANFVSGATVSIGGVAATNVTVVNTTTITAKTASHAAGLVNVIVTNPDTQTSTLVNGFTYSSSATLALDTTSLRFAATNSGAAFVQQTPGQTVRLTQSGPGTATWTAASSQPWLTVSPASGTGPATLTIGVVFDAAVPMSGTSSGIVTLTLTGTGSTAGPISVGLTTVASNTSAPPTGAVDTPLDNSTGVTGSLAVTGWAIDDIGVQKVEIFRDPVAGEGAAPIFIGTAVLVDGARPDIAVPNPTTPRSTQAGWGYLMLTNFLPNQGNGTFRITAIATDIEGKTTTLGVRTITCANDSAIKPFGAIDTPGQGEVVSGTSYNNFGWVLARGDNVFADPPHGGTVSAFVDGVNLGTPGAWVSRSDLTALFPASTYPGVPNALGVLGINTTSLSNGVHTIFWVVTANNGQQDGIGSRFFTVANSGLHADSATRISQLASRGSQLAAHDTGMSTDRTESLRLEAPALLLPDRVPSSSLRAAVSAAAVERRGILGRRGYDFSAPLRYFDVAVNGRATVQAEELDRIELQLGGAGYTGYLRVGEDLGPLPIGSHLDAATGAFTWGVGVGFVHDYDLVFVRWAQGHAVLRQDVRITLRPKQGNRVGPQVMIDAPASAEATAGKPVSVSQPFLVGGWAADLDEAVGTGVETLHVWAYPTSACGPREESQSSSAGAVNNDCDPIFLGATAYGGERPDVAAIFGNQYARSGYNLIVDSLAPGTYDLAVFAWSTVTRGFVPAKIVRVSVR